MPTPGRSSSSSGGLPVDVFWHAIPDRHLLSEHVDAITEVLMDVVTAPAGRRWNPYNATMARREFRHRLVEASRGALTPLDHVKSIEHPLAAEMFEVRWQHVRVTEERPDGRLRHRDAQVRLLHAEPGALGVVALGLHAHEKVVVPGDARATRAAQDAEIVRATSVYATALPVWLTRSPVQPLQRDLDGSIG
ncbi:hypothetical protein [Cellulomonas sp. S1-8]|uniref:hypothetical protein n=1 Tax=Cellulomonas sp. S1-8 TaxID=2904790 RepID=UPI002244312E|nr:hypothetical protein [Cellulomonas sp. S1-8]UZN02679.1 hypothetical protein OKX07_16725 [Cellulomonas sp. S1-8]